FLAASDPASRTIDPMQPSEPSPSPPEPSAFRPPLRGSAIGLPLAAAILGVLLGLALAVGAGLVAGSVRDFRLLDRSVEVKGLAEREVPADLAIWPITHSAAGNDVAALYRELDRTGRRIVAFLVDAGCPAAARRRPAGARVGRSATRRVPLHRACDGHRLFPGRRTRALDDAPARGARRRRHRPRCRCGCG